MEGVSLLPFESLLAKSVWPSNKRKEAMGHYKSLNYLKGHCVIMYNTYETYKSTFNFARKQLVIVMTVMDCNGRICR